MTEDLGTLKDLYGGLKTYARNQGSQDLRHRYGQPDAAPVEGATGGEPDASRTGEGEGSLDDAEQAAMAALMAEQGV